ncbi:MAG TPA: bifunctional ADP-dependent NAD(P)H-hydrate dehydratase/NAD(P)H-hydrate epimerase [Bacteroidales bacterium]|nr:bifunctional ADP-dependent NAD(P)H-hydrate dehydratase/NAD(P)H-hydrate epimerase [Bacteroidales bacterium]
MKIFRSGQIRLIDEFTIKNEPISSIDLMERAASKLFEWYTERFPRSCRILIFAGPGNNGGDGLALVRMLAKDRYQPEVFFLNISDTTSVDWKINRGRLEKETSVPFSAIDTIDQFPLISSDDVIIDAIFGSGLSRPVTGLAAEIIQQINKTGGTVISVDIPSGLFGEDNSRNDPENIIRADFTLSFQFPKLSFMFRENEIFTGDWSVLPIGLDQRVIFNTETPYELVEKAYIASLLKKRNKFDHKGNFGHGLLIGGSYGKMGAVIMGAKAALRTGAGLISCHVPACGNLALQIAVSEAMVISDKSGKYITGISSPDIFDAFGIGPGMGTVRESHGALYQFLVNCKKPLVIDADALNILSANREWLSIIPEKCILTPHPKEFERLAGKTESGYARLEKQIEFSQKHNCIVVLKSAHTSVSTPAGDVWFNSTGNPGMATAGAGDVLTGMILSLLAQGYDPADAAVTGVFLHGLAGDIAAVKSCYESLIASDIIDSISDAFRRIRGQD